MTSPRSASRLLVALGAAVLAAGLAACAPGADAAPTASAPSSTPPAPASPTPRASEDLAWPDTERPDQVGSVRMEPQDGIPTTDTIIGPAVVEAGRSLRVTGQCVGTRMQYEVRTSTVGEDPRVLFDGTVECTGGEVVASLGGSDYTGSVHLALVEATGVDLGWLQATQELD